jgi:nucleotide-binding universal stress UspA family protein
MIRAVHLGKDRAAAAHEDPHMARSRLIIVGIDFSHGSFVALDQAAVLAGAWRVPICCAHVIDEHDLSDLAIALDRPIEALLERAREDAEESFAAALLPLGVSLDIVTEVALGHPHKCLGDLVRAAQSQLLIVGARGHEGEPGVGSTALACVRDASADVLVVSDDNVGSYDRVLACTSLGHDSGAVVRRAAEMVAPGGTLDILHSMAPLGQRMLPAAQERFEHWTREGLSRTAGQVADLCAAHRIQANEILVMGRRTAESIVRTASERDSDLVVLGKRSRSAMANTLISGIAMSVISSAPCSVLAVNTVVDEREGRFFDEVSERDREPAEGAQARTKASAE